jgi:hypothetical protein
MRTDELLTAIGKLGDALLRPEFSPEDEAGEPIPFEPPPINPRSLLVGRFADEVRAAKGPVTVILASLLYGAALPVDALRLVAKGCLFPFAWVSWRGERWLARRTRGSHLCPLCTNPIQDPLVFCPRCGRIQPRIQPTWSAPLAWPCYCGESRWPTLGQYFGGSRGPLVCRDQPHFTGCHRRTRLEGVAGRYVATHVALFGASLKAKHAVMGHLFARIADGTDRGGLSATPAWDLSRLELDLARSHLIKAFVEDTAPAESPGAEYTLGLAFLAHSRDTGRLYHIRNLAEKWVARTDRLAEKSLDWNFVRCLALVLDPTGLGRFDTTEFLPHAEVLSRLIRVIEEYLEIPPGDRLPHSLAVILPLPDLRELDSLRLELDAPHGEGAVDDRIRSVLRDRDPALIALVDRCFEPSRVGFFAGPIPNTLDLKATEWLKQVLDWLF